MTTPKASFSQPIRITRKHVIIALVLMTFLLILSLGSLIFVLASSSTNRSYYQTIATEFNQLEATVAQGNTALENIDALDKRINQLEVENKKIKVDYDNLDMRSARNEQDIFIMKTIVNDKNLDNKLELLTKGVNDNVADIDLIKRIQTKQQSVIEDLKDAFDTFKNNIVNKITAMLSGKSSPGSQPKKKLTLTKPNFNFQLSSVEYRAGENWAVFVPKTGITQLSELKFLAVGDVLDNWVVTNITGNTVQLTKDGQQLTLSAH